MTDIRKKVVLSGYCFAVSFICTALMVAVFLIALNRAHEQLWAVYTLGGIILLMALSALYYMPGSLSFDGRTLDIHRSLRIKQIPLAEIADVRLCQPTMAAKRLCGSGGWFGWYGWFSEPDLGRYFAYYGRASDCFLVTLRSGRKYMLGCKDAPAMVAALRSALAKQRPAV
ncbi:MAG: PH domain-containing protein [Muribaculaceae bacterium]|nr:PH domain-containing protein [Muribaculaceae bacterium]